MPEEQYLTDSVFIVPGLFTPEECEEFIAIAEDVGFEDALVSTPDGIVRRAAVRNNERVMFSSAEFAERLWERVEDFVPTEFEGRSSVGLNELVRFYRYDVGQRFEWHQDFPYERDNGEASFLTFMVYLNDGFDRGETSFEDSYTEDSFDEFSVKPQRGMGLFFEHAVHHKGEPVLEGRKYVLRTDVMYASDEELGGPEDELDDFDTAEW